MAAMRNRNRKRKAGLASMEVWAHPDDHQDILEYAATLAKARDQAANVESLGTSQEGAASRLDAGQGISNYLDQFIDGEPPMISGHEDLSVCFGCELCFIKNPKFKGYVKPDA